MNHSPQKIYAVNAPVDESALDANTSYAQILKMIEGAPRVLDLGCGPGNLSRLLAQRGCNIVGVDVSEEHAVLAREYCSDVLVADLDKASLLGLFPTDRFDVAIFADILEHLRNPARLLSEVGRVLRSGGYVIASIPNIAHGAVRLSMLRGEFNYQELGILDDTHLRFFTHKSLEKLFEQSGLAIEDIVTTTVPIFEGTGTLVPAVDRNDFPPEIVVLVESDPEAHTLQFIVRAIPATAVHVHQNALRRKNIDLIAEVADLQKKLERANLELADKADIPSVAHYNDVLERLHGATTELELREAENKQLTGAIGAVERRAISHQSQIEQSQRERKREREELTALLAIADEENAALSARASGAESLAERSTSLETENDMLRRQAQDLYLQFEALLAERNTLIGRADRALEQIERMAGEAEVLKKQAEDSVLAAAENERLQADVARLSGVADRLQEQREANEDRLGALEVQMQGAQCEATRARTKLNSVLQRNNIAEAARAAATAELEALRSEHLALSDAAAERTSRARELAEKLADQSKTLEIYRQSLAKMQADIAEITAHRDLVLQHIGHANHILAAMRDSKFWRMRNVWFRAKRLFGISTDIP